MLQDSPTVQIKTHTYQPPHLMSILCYIAGGEATALWHLVQVYPYHCHRLQSQGHLEI
jgi:hypothetical protein